MAERDKQPGKSAQLVEFFHVVRSQSMNSAQKLTNSNSHYPSLHAMVSRGRRLRPLFRRRIRTWSRAPANHVQERNVSGFQPKSIKIDLASPRRARKSAPQGTFWGHFLSRSAVSRRPRPRRFFSSAISHFFSTLFTKRPKDVPPAPDPRTATAPRFAPVVPLPMGRAISHYMSSDRSGCRVTEHGNARPGNRIIHTRSTTTSAPFSASTTPMAPALPRLRARPRSAP